jgi:hypothetical protein
MSVSSFPSQAQPVANRCCSRQGNDPSWRLLKNTICELYATNELKDVMRIMVEEYEFRARYKTVHSMLLLFPILTIKSEKLYKTKFHDWGINTKRIKSCEYKAILKKKRKREQNSPGKATKFQLHGEIVLDDKIVGWETRMRKRRRITENDTFS